MIARNTLKKIIKEDIKRYFDPARYILQIIRNTVGKAIENYRAATKEG